MIRVLQVYPQMNNAGTEMVIMNLYRNIDRSKVQFDFLVQKHGELDALIEEMGGAVHCIPLNNEYSKSVDAFFEQHSEYRIVHTHTHMEMGKVLKAAYRVGVPTRIAHSHNSRADLPGIVSLVKRATSYPIEKYATDFLACSVEAAKWLFPRKYKECTIWNNGIDLVRFSFNAESRSKIRQQYGIPDDSKVVCHVGRFARQKNHEKIISLLNELTMSDPHYYAYLVGVGPLFEKIKDSSKSDHIFFLGNRTDVPDILSASDIFVFPSLWEGLGIVAIEAQANGIPCICSERVPKAADLGIGLFEQISLSENDEEWKYRITALCDNRISFEERSNISAKALESTYDIKSVAHNAENFYLSRNK